MLKLYAGRENIDKERFIYDCIKSSSDGALVLVPDQYTLIAEEQALKYLDTDCLFDVEILSMNRLGMRVLTEKGTESVSMIDKYGRFMLLAKLIRKHREDLSFFRRSASRLSFIAMLNDFISEFKQQDCSAEYIAAMIDDCSDELLKAKLTELLGVISEYEEMIRGRFTDSEDYIAMYISAIRGSSFVSGRTIWIYGYDSITAKFRDAVTELAAAADVNFIINRSDFGLDEMLEASLVRACADKDIGCRVYDIPCEGQGCDYRIDTTETIKRIEKGLFAPAPPSGENEDFSPDDLVMVRAANPYYEAETAAAYIWHLVRDKGFRFREIQVIANDETTFHPVIRRVFGEYGIPLFMDSPRDITDTAPAAFIVNLLRFAVHRGASQYLFAMLKTGLSGFDTDLYEELENYVRSYHIRGSMWERDFRYGADNAGQDKFAMLNDLRSGIMDKIMPLKELISGKDRVKSAGEFASSFAEYLNGVWELEDRTRDAADEADRAGYHDEAQRIVQSWSRSIELLEQIKEIMGDEELDIREFADIYEAGLTSVEVGVIPPAADGLPLGTMIRTRPRPVRAVMVLGANEGVMPMTPSPEGLFSVDEKEYFKSKDFALGALDDIKAGEENAAMYRIMSRASENLYMSWSLSDIDGGDVSPAPVIESLRSLFPAIDREGRIHRDIISSGWGASIFAEDDGAVHAGDAVASDKETLRHLMTHLKDRNADTRADSQTEALLKWYSENRPEELRSLMRAAADINAPVPLGRKLASDLFGRPDGSLVLSASAIGSYFECPFRYYIDRGLRPREEREFSGDPRSIGDAYHECLMRVAERLLGDRVLLSCFSGPDAPWEEIEKMVDEELERISAEYRGGLFISAGNEMFRMDRIREICSAAARSMAKQLASDSLVDASFEESFRRGGRFDPVKLEVAGTEVYVEGKIDRADILDTDGTRRVRIIDYKTGSDSLNVWKMRNGYKMQLMIYMLSASGEELEPAGLFYFNIRDPIESADGKSSKKLSEIEERRAEDTYKLRGRYIDEPGVLEAMPEDVLASSRSSRDRSLSREEYEILRNDVSDRIRETAEGILGGRVDIRPLKEGGRLACSHCSYRAVCRRDRDYPANRSRMIPPEQEPEKES